MNNYKPNQKVQIIIAQIAVAAEFPLMNIAEMNARLKHSLRELINNYPHTFLDYQVEMGKADDTVKLSGVVEDGDAFLLNDLMKENAKRRQKPCASCIDHPTDYNLCRACGGCSHTCSCIK